MSNDGATPTISFGSDISVERIQSMLRRYRRLLIAGVDNQNKAVRLLKGVGRLMRQPGGHLVYDVKSSQEFARFSYSQSANAIRAHTENPAELVPPRFIALYCHRQARCGGGYTEYLSFGELLPLLSREERELLNVPVTFPPHSNDGPPLSVAILTASLNGGDVFRYSSNLLAFGEYNPAVSGSMEPESLPLGPGGRRLAEHIEAIFEDRCARILIPEGGMFIWDNHTVLHARSLFLDRRRHLVRFFLA